jgi:hypothetical protein
MRVAVHLSDCVHLKSALVSRKRPKSKRADLIRSLEMANDWLTEFEVNVVLSDFSAYLESIAPGMSSKLAKIFPGLVASEIRALYKLAIH